MSVIYYAEGNPNKTTTAPFPKPTATTLLGWDYMAKPITYYPFLIRAVSRVGTVLTFRFIQCAANATTGNDVGGDHTVDLADLTLVFAGAPSTLPTAAGTYSPTGSSYAFLFLTEMYLKSEAQLTADAGGGGGGSGKHPYGSEY